MTEYERRINNFDHLPYRKMRKAKVQKPFIHYEPLKPWEITVIKIYAIITLCIASSSLILSAEGRQVAIIIYAGFTQLFSYVFLYVSLRNFKVYLIWFSFGVIHFILYLCFKADIELEMVNGNPSRLLINTLPLLLLFQLLRYFSMKAQRREFVVPAKGGGPDIIERKNVSGIDYLILLIYLGTWFGLIVLFWG